MGSIGFGVLAGCSGDGGSNGNGGDDGTDDGNGGTDGGDGGTGSVNIPGLESVTVAGGNITVRRAEDSEVDGVRLYGPDNEQMGRGTSFNNVQREINYSISSRSQLSSSGNYGSWPSGTYTLEAVGEGGSQIGTAPLTLEREFEVVGASIGSRTGDGTFVVFEIENTGDLPVNFDRVRVLESSEVEGYRALDGSSEDEDVVMSEGYRGSAVKPGRTGTVRGRVEFTYVNRDFEEGGKEAFETPPVPPCDDWE
ncbi:MAG: hypothetical protein V5A27_09220, partial [Halapricum sp.]